MVLDTSQKSKIKIGFEEKISCECNNHCKYLEYEDKCKRKLREGNKIIMLCNRFIV